MKKKKKKLITDHYILRKVVEQIKEVIRVTNIDDTKILIDTGDELPDDITFRKICYKNDMCY